MLVTMLIVSSLKYHDKVTAGNGEKEDHPLGKGSAVVSHLSSLRNLPKKIFPTHYINMVGANKMICKKGRYRSIRSYLS